MEKENRLDEVMSGASCVNESTGPSDIEVAASYALHVPSPGLYHYQEYIVIYYSLRPILSTLSVPCTKSASINMEPRE